MYRPSVPYIIPPQPESPKVKQLKDRLQLLLRENLEQELAPKQNKDMLIDLKLRLFHLMRQPIQNQYEIQLIRDQLDQQVKKKLTPKETMERNREIQLVLEELDDAQRQAVVTPAAPRVAAISSSSTAEQQTKVLQDIQKQLSALLKKDSTETAPKVSAPPKEAAAAAPGGAPEPVKIKAEKVKRADKTYISLKTKWKVDPKLSTQFPYYQVVENTDGNGFFRAVGFVILQGLDNYNYKELLDYIENTFKGGKQDECVLNFESDIKDKSDGNPVGYITTSKDFDTKVVCAIKHITLAYITQNPAYKNLTDTFKSDNPVADLNVMKLVCKVFKVNIGLMTVLENNNLIVFPIKGDDKRALDAYINEQVIKEGSTQQTYVYIMSKNLSKK